MSCPQCQQAILRKAWGGYAMACVRCCARLLRSARPLRDAQEGLLYAIGRRPGRPNKTEILRALKAMD